MSNTPLSIGALAARTGCSVPTIRYYEQIGLLPRAGRAASWLTLPPLEQRGRRHSHME